MVTVVVYGKPGCHLCEDAVSVLREAQRSYGFSIEEVNILEDEKLFNEYVEDIPVVVIDGEIFAKYVVRAEALEARLTSL